MGHGWTRIHTDKKRVGFVCVHSWPNSFWRCGERWKARRRTIFAAASAKTTTIAPRRYAAAAAEMPTPVTAVSQAARHNGHFGRNSTTAPGSMEAPRRESRRARRRDGPPAVQHCACLLYTSRCV